MRPSLLPLWVLCFTQRWKLVLEKKGKLLPTVKLGITVSWLPENRIPTFRSPSKKKPLKLNVGTARKQKLGYMLGRKKIQTNNEQGIGYILRPIRP